MIFWEQEENGKHFSKLRGKKSTVSLFAAFVETPHTSHLRDMKVNERLYFAPRVVAGICNVNSYGRLSGSCRDKGQWQWQTHHCVCLNMQYQANLPGETFTPPETSIRHHKKPTHCSPGSWTVVERIRDGKPVWELFFEGGRWGGGG